MMSVIKKDISKIAILVALAVGLIGATFIFTDAVPPKDSAVEVSSSSVSVTIQDTYTRKPFTISKDETVLQVLQALDATDPNLKLQTKGYKGLGTLVTAMGPHKNGDGNQYWQYKINGVMPQVGADGYKLQGGEEIDWYFAPSQE